MSTVAIPTLKALLRRPEDQDWFEGALPGELVRYRVRGEQVNGAYSIVESIFPPLAGPPLHIHENEDEVFRILEASLSFLCKGDRFDAPAGSMVVIRKNAQHTWKNIMDAPARVLVTFAPGGAEGMFAAISGQPVNQIVEIAARFGCRVVGPPL